MAGGIYDLEGSGKDVKLLKEMLSIRLEVTVLKDLLMKHGVIDEYEYDACKKYHASTGEIKTALDYLNQVEAQINRYKADPQQHLRDIFNAKLNGQL